MKARKKVIPRCSYKDEKAFYNVTGCRKGTSNILRQETGFSLSLWEQNEDSPCPPFPSSWSLSNSSCYG